jgi:CobQ-like glutamine amidotransferase family enzyme
VIRAYDEAGNVIETHERALRRGYSITMNALNRTAKLRRDAAFPKVLS